MNPKIFLLLTFDYEIFLGTNLLPPEKTLFEPASRIMELCDKLNVKATFFPDVCSVWAHRAASLYGFSDEFENQLKKALRSGHDVQLHLHPHWLDSTYEKGKWIISTDRMFLHELGFGGDDRSAGALIGRGVSYLNELLQPISPGYRCLAFRAAALALQPNEKAIISALAQNGIKVDTSIAKGLKMNVDTVSIDYKRMPSSANWYVDQEKGLEEEAAQGILEIPIVSFKSNIPTQLRFIIRRAKSIKQMRGMTLSRVKRQSRFANLWTMILYNMKYVTGRPWFLLSFDTKGFNTKMLLDGFANYVACHKNNRIIMASLISHPKLMFEDQLRWMEEFIEETRNRYDITYVTCSEAYQLFKSLNSGTPN